MRTGSLNWGLLFIIAGLALLGWTTGRLPIEVWYRLADLWPMLVIALGLHLIFYKSKLPQLALLSTVVIIGSAIYAFYPYVDYIKEGHREQNSGNIEQIISEQVQALEIRTDFNRREFTLTDQEKSGVILRYSKEYNAPELSYNAKDDIATMKIVQFDDDFRRYLKWLDYPYWRLKISENYPVNLDIKAKNSYCYLRMADLDIRSLEVDCEKCRDVVLQFGDKFPLEPIKLDLKRSKLRIEIPEKYGVVLKDGVLMSPKLCEDLGFVEDGDDLKSDSVFVSDSILVLDIGPGLKSLEINKY